VLVSLYRYCSRLARWQDASYWYSLVGPLVDLVTLLVSAIAVGSAVVDPLVDVGEVLDAMSGASGDVAPSGRSPNIMMAVLYGLGLVAISIKDLKTSKEGSGVGWASLVSDECICVGDRTVVSSQSVSVRVALLITLGSLTTIVRIRAVAVGVVLIGIRLETSRRRSRRWWLLKRYATVRNWRELNSWRIDDPLLDRLTITVVRRGPGDVGIHTSMSVGAAFSNNGPVSAKLSVGGEGWVHSDTCRGGKETFFA